MRQPIRLKAQPLEQVSKANPMLVSYNIEFAEITGGTFWRAYTPEQVAGRKPFVFGTIDPENGALSMENFSLMQVYPAIDLYSEKLRKLASALGPAWVRVSGSWATQTYYDFDGTTNGVVPKGYKNVLTKDQWIGVLDFVKHVGGKLLISLADCEGLHSTDTPWNPSEAEKIFKLSESYGVPIEAVEFANQPDMIHDKGFPVNYTLEAYRRDQDIGIRWIRENYPECIIVGPATAAVEIPAGKTYNTDRVMRDGTLSIDELMTGIEELPDALSYHCYYGTSERLAEALPGWHWDAEDVLSDLYLDVWKRAADVYGAARDRYIPGAELWVTEAADASGGGNTWASTYLDVPRTLTELAAFSEFDKGIIFHNTLASSDYGYLQRITFDPRPNYFAVLLWNRLMGTEVLKHDIDTRYVYARNRKDGKEGCVYLIVNNHDEAMPIELEKDAEAYVLLGSDNDLRSDVMTLNGKPLQLTADGELPEMAGKTVPAGVMELPAYSCAFIVL